MRVRVTMPTKDGKRLREQIVEGAEKVEDDEMGQDEWEAVSFDFSCADCGQNISCPNP